MKIEKISDNQIRCTLTRRDLSDRQIQLEELAYGSEKTRRLFSDMMQQANYEFGFESDNYPLMIEAIPTTEESIILIITKVEDPEELDTRFSRFTQTSDSDKGSNSDRRTNSADAILELFNKLRDDQKQQGGQEYDARESSAASQRSPGDPVRRAPKRSAGQESAHLIQSFIFPTFDDVTRAARGLAGRYSGVNSLYRVDDGDYQLIIHQAKSTPDQYNMVCSILSEYGREESFSAAREAFLREHNCMLLADRALQELSKF